MKCSKCAGEDFVPPEPGSYVCEVCGMGVTYIKKKIDSWSPPESYDGYKTLGKPYFSHLLEKIQGQINAAMKSASQPGPIASAVGRYDLFNEDSWVQSVDPAAVPWRRVFG